VRAIYLRRDHLQESYDPDFATSFKWALDLLDGYRAVFVTSDAGIARTQFWHAFRKTHAAIRQLIRTERTPTALLIHSYTRPEALAGLLAAKSMRIPVLLMGESELVRRRSRARRVLRAALLPRLLRLIDAYLYIGTQDRLFYERYGEPQRLFFTPYAVDNDAFSQRLATNLATRDATRRVVGVPRGDKVLLFCGKLIARKRPLDVVDAVALLEQSERPFLVFVGSGPLDNAIRARAAALGVTKLVITGFKNTDEIGAYYAAADAFVLPSEFETWGLVVNEAMLHSLPVIVSDCCGCAADLVADGRTGSCFPAGHVASLAHSIRSLLSDELRRQHLGTQARTLIQSWSFSQVEEGVRAALSFVAGTRSRSHGVHSA
jgi:glycosyltransferase involved in cell wall biosynthesis